MAGEAATSVSSMLCVVRWNFPLPWNNRYKAPSRSALPPRFLHTRFLLLLETDQGRKPLRQIVLSKPHSDVLCFGKTLQYQGAQLGQHRVHRALQCGGLLACGQGVAQFVQQFACLIGNTWREPQTPVRGCCPQILMVRA